MAHAIARWMRGEYMKRVPAGNQPWVAVQATPQKKNSTKVSTFALDSLKLRLRSPFDRMLQKVDTIKEQFYAYS
jgi:hypothetical protein